MVTLKCKISEETRRKHTYSYTVNQICHYLAGEFAYQRGDIIVSAPEKDGCFYIVLGGSKNKENLTLETII